jgi:antitoxin component YwqK of YwqJK toxin-antitoxin module
MKANNLIYFILSLAVYLTSCENRNCIIEEQNTNGNILIRRKINQCNNAILYDQEFLIVSKDSFIENGYYKTYNSNGSINSIAYFKNGLQDSIAIKYYENGNKEMELYWANGKMQGFQNWYSPNGAILKKKYYVQDSSVLLSIIYNQKGQIENFDGKTLYVFGNKDISNISKGERFLIANQIVQLEAIKSILKVKFYTPDGKKIIDTTFTKFKSMGNIKYIPIVYTASNIGIYSYYADVQLVDVKTNKILKEDSTSIKINIE